jgi:hypothetical protein
LADINKQAEKRIAANNSKKRDRERSATVSKYTKKLKGAKGTAVPVREGKAARTANDLAIEVPIKSELRDEIDLRGSSDGSKDPDEVATLLEVTQREFLRYIRAHDVVITTYQDCESADSIPRSEYGKLTRQYPRILLSLCLSLLAPGEAQ